MIFVNLSTFVKLFGFASDKSISTSSFFSKKEIKSKKLRESINSLSKKSTFLRLKLILIFFF